MTDVDVEPTQPTRDGTATEVRKKADGEAWIHLAVIDLMLRSP